jgi:pimeloyl-ACP methyl ester carboxylesterase
MNSHFLDSAPDANFPPLLLMHGLTANARAFDGLLQAGLGKKYRVILPDLRGRGKSPKPETGYSFAEHAQDIIELLNYLQLYEPIVIGGHSFGGFLAFYIAKNFPDRVKELVILDAAAKMPIETRDRLVPTLSRLGQEFDDFEAYLGKIKNAPYLTFWEESMLSYFQADVMPTSAGKITPIPQIAHIAQCAQAVLSEPLDTYIGEIKHPVSLFFATDNYTLGAPLIPQEYALDTIQRLSQARHFFVAGNHQTMLYGEGAKQIVENL